MEPKFEVFKDTLGQYRFRLVAPNGEKIAASESYYAKQSCLNGIEAVRKYAAIAKIVDLT